MFSVEQASKNLVDSGGTEIPVESSVARRRGGVPYALKITQYYEIPPEKST
jgi:hypothetical protein